MSRILLISSNSFTHPYPVYPLGMAVISAALLKSGHDVRQFDFLKEVQSLDRLKEVIGDYSPDYTGISIRNIDSVDSLAGEIEILKNEKEIVQVIRQHSNAPIIIGGSAFSAMPEEIIDYVDADYGIIGRGEDLIISLIENLDNGVPVPRLQRQSGSTSDTPLTISPKWEKSMVEYYLDKSGMLNIQAKSGCPFKCSYCVYPCLEGSRFSYRDPESVVDDLKRAWDLYNADTFFFTDSVFNDPEGYYLELAEKIILSGLNIRWAGYFRPQGTGLEEIRLLKRSGLFAAEVGSDAASDFSLQNLEKGFSFDDIIAFHNALVKGQILTSYFFIFGGPGETEESVKDGLINIRKLDQSVIFFYSGIRILPGTGLYSLAIKEGIIAKGDPLLKPRYYFSRDIDVKRMNDLIEEEARGKRRYIFPPEKGEKLANIMHSFGYKGLLWDQLLL